MSRPSTKLIMPGSGGASRLPGGSLGLTPEMLRKSRRRVQIIAWIVMGMMALGAPFQVIMRVTGGLSQAAMLQSLTGILLAGSCAVLLVGIARSGRIPDAVVI